MRRVLPSVVLLGLVLGGCASPQADLQDQVAEVTAAANDGDVEALLAEARELEGLVDRLAESDELTAAQATGLRNAAIALQQRAGQVRRAPEPVETTPPPPEPTEEPEPPPPPPEPEETEEPEPSPTPEPEETEEPEPTEEPDDDGGLVPLPTAEQTRASSPAEPTASPVAAAPAPSSSTPAPRARATSSPSRPPPTATATARTA